MIEISLVRSVYTHVVSKHKSHIDRRIANRSTTQWQEFKTNSLRREEQSTKEKNKHAYTPKVNKIQFENVGLLSYVDDEYK